MTDHKGRRPKGSLSEDEGAGGDSALLERGATSLPVKGRANRSKERKKSKPAARWRAVAIPDSDASGQYSGGDGDLTLAEDSAGAQTVGVESVDDPVNQPQAEAQAPSLIVALGASAGGLQPLEDFFRNINPKAGHAYVVIQHLSPDFKSLMSELLGRQTTMQVHRIEHGMKLRANGVYLIPPRTNLSIDDDVLLLEEQNLDHSSGPQFPIDVFFRSLATSARSRAVAVILSGTGSDGSRGVRAIDEGGGMVYVQDPNTAQFDGMPNAARANVKSYQLLSPAEIAQSISGIELNGDSLRVEGSPTDIEQSTLDKIISLVSNEVENDFAAYKIKTLSRRIHRRSVITGQASLESYYDALKDSKVERQELSADLLISVTSFFRDEAAWVYLRDEAFPQLIANLPTDHTLRIWVSACSTGEEAYTMAMVAREAMEQAGRSGSEIKIFATDVDPVVLERAAAGVYPESIVADVPRDMLAKYFSIDGENYVVSRHLREMIIFAPHNILMDAPFARMHLATCRNALIYFQQEAQDRIISMLHFSLVPSGVLMLGASESVGALEPEFKALNRQWCIFSKLRDVRVPIESNFRTRLVGARKRNVTRSARANGESVHDTMIRDALQSIALERNWVCLLCDGHSNVLHVLGDSHRYLQVPQGGLTAEVTRLVHDELAIPLRSAMHRAQRERETVSHTRLSCDMIEGLVDIQVIFRPTSATSQEMYVVTLMSSDAKVVEASDMSEQSGETDLRTAQQLNELELELRQTRENLQATIEELETTNEEQQATNEQLTAANEELQSTNEELHSVNEELYTVNSEYQLKITELTEVTNDIDNLLESTDIGVVFLDNDLKIRKFTPAATRDVHLLPGDIGRSFDDLSYHFEYSELTADLRRVLSLGEAIEREVRSGKNEYLLVRIHPYRAGSELTVGIVMTFVNISELKRVEDALAQVETRYRHLFQSEMFGITLGNLRDRVIVDANDAYLKLVDLNRSSLPIQHKEVYPESELPELDRALHELELSGTNPPAPVLLRRPNGKLVSVIVGRTLISKSEGTYVAFVLATDTLTDQAGLRLQQKAHELESVRENLQQFAYIASHQLQEPLRAVSGFSKLLSERYAGKFDEKGNQYLGHIDQGTERMSGIVDDLLLFSRVHTHAGPMEWISAANAVDAAVKQLETKIEKHRAEVTHDPLPMVYVEATQLQQVFFALIDNAIKFKSAADPKIKISAVKSDDHWQFEVKDNGIGIHADSFERVFLMFQRLDPEQVASSRGIGLAICRRVIERHQGRIWIESRVDEGSAVCFTLPLRQASDNNETGA